MTLDWYADGNNDSQLVIFIESDFLSNKYHSFFILLWYAQEWLFESTLLVSILLKNQLFSHFDFVRHTSYEIVCIIILCFPPFMKIITNCLMSNFLISLFLALG